MCDCIGASIDENHCCKKCFPLYMFIFPFKLCCNNYTVSFLHYEIDNEIEPICKNCFFNDKFYVRRGLPPNTFLRNYIDSQSCEFSSDVIECIILVFKLGFLDETEDFYKKLSSIEIFENIFDYS